MSNANYLLQTKNEFFIFIQALSLQSNIIFDKVALRVIFYALDILVLKLLISYESMCS